MKLTIETERETDGRWIAEVMEIPGVIVYGSTIDEAIAKVQALARIAKRTGLRPEDL
jgi:predicted RNase H-like HicB family nuclease